MTTIAPSMSQKLAQEASSSGVDFLDAPVSGGSQGAIKGTLTIMVGGEQEAFEQALPVLASDGQAREHFLRRAERLRRGGEDRE